MKFKIHSPFQPSGDQPKAIKEVVENIEKNVKHQVILGVTGSGKTFTMAKVIEKVQKPTLVLVHNKTLAAQLFGEFKSLFPENAVEYFVSYYDYYQPEAYVVSTGTYIEKDSSINEQIDRMRHSATRSLMERKDVLIVASVSCIYGLGSPEMYEKMTLEVKVNEELNRDVFLRELVKLQYSRNDVDFHRSTFRVRGDVVDVFPASEEKRCVRLEFFGNFIDKITWMDFLTTQVLEEVDRVSFFPTSHYVGTEEVQKKATESIRDELRDRIRFYEKGLDREKARHIEQRTSYDLEMIQEMGFCPGIENYSRHFSGRKEGEPPPTLLEYFSRDFLVFVDESHATLPQVGGMYRGDRMRKMNLVEHAFRLPSALDNRPLNFQEFEGLLNKAVYVSATPASYEMEKSEGLVVELVNRPTGLLDPKVQVRSAKHQVDDLLKEIRIRVKKGQRVLVTTLTKKMAEDLTDYYSGLGVKVKYLHSDIKTIERSEIIRDLRLGVFHVLVGINLLREGLDIPEVSLVAIMDADKEGFLRSERALIQTMGRAARHKEGEVFLYGDRVTGSMEKAIGETSRRRKIQEIFNKKHGLTPQSIQKSVSKSLMELYESSPYQRTLTSEKKLKYISEPRELRKNLQLLREDMRKAAEDLDFEKAAEIRDEIKRLEIMELEFLEGEPFGKDSST